MKRYHYIGIIVLSLAVLLSFQTIPRASNPLPARIEANQESGRIDFYINDSLAAVPTEDGLHVREGVNYGSTLTDTGSIAFDRAFAEGAANDAD